MTSRPKNVLLLSVDTLRADRLGTYGYARPTTPALDAFAEDALVMERAYTLGPFTQLACIQLFTSSRPYDYGGYDRGAVGRPNTLFKRFKDSGYATWGLSTIHWVSPYYGYTDGLDEGVFVFHLNTLVGMAAMNMRDTLRVYFDGKIGEAEMLADVVPNIRRLFNNVEDYTRMLDRRREEYRRDFPYSKIVNDRYVPARVRAVVAEHRDAFEADQVGYIHTHLRTAPDAHEWLARSWRFCREPGKLFGEAALRASNALIRRINPAWAGRRETRYRFAVDAHAIADKTIGALGNMPDDRPFFVWAHFKDSHQPYVSGSGPDWVNQTHGYLRNLGYTDDIDPTVVFRGAPKTPERTEAFSALYDASVRSTDAAIGRILDALERDPRHADTVVAICGDHGEELGEHGDFGHLCMHYDHNARIPMMFRAPGLGAGRSENLVTSLDFAPSLAAYAGIDAAPDWVGSAVTDPAVGERDHVLMESFCRGNCIFEHRPLYMAVRDRRYKYMWREYVDWPHKKGRPEPMLFDLDNDPGETENIHDPAHPAVRNAERIIAERLCEVPEITDERITANFGDIGRDAIAAARTAPHGKSETGDD